MASSSSSPPPPSPPGPETGLKVINASLFRMGTKSMARAYQILGYKTHHGLLETVFEGPWVQIEQAAEATFGPHPNAPGRRPDAVGGPLPNTPTNPPRPPFTRVDWDGLWGDKWEVVTDLASPFAPELIKAYPDAKVVVVQRDFEKWWPSFAGQVLNKVLNQPVSGITGFVCSRILGLRCVHAMRKVLFGFMGAATQRECNDLGRARRVYEDYFEEVRRLAPPGRRLEYKMGDGWEPLCEFLGVPVPEGVPFPRENETEAHQEDSRNRVAGVYLRAAKALLPFVVAVGVAGAAWWYVR